MTQVAGASQSRGIRRRTENAAPSQHDDGDQCEERDGRGAGDPKVARQPARSFATPRVGAQRCARGECELEPADDEQQDRGNGGCRGARDHGRPSDLGGIGSD